MNIKLQDRLTEQFEQLQSQIVSGDIPATYGIRKLFDMGYKIEDEGLEASANTFYSRTINLLEQLRGKTSLKLSLQDFAELAISHGHRLHKLNKHHSAALAFKRAIETLDEILHQGVSRNLIEELASAYYWYAFCQRKLNNTETAISAYKKSLGLLNGLSCFSTGRKRDFRIYVISNGVKMALAKLQAPNNSNNDVN